MWSVSDESLLAGLAARDPDATEAFVARFQRRVYGLARAITGDGTLAEDVAQEALLRAWRHAAAYDPRRGSVTTWLLTITRNLAIDQVRVRRPSVGDPDELLASVLAAPGPGPAEAAIVTEDVGAAPRGVGRAPARAAPGDRPGRSARAERPRGRGSRGDPAGHGEDPDPHRDAPTAGGPGARGARRMSCAVGRGGGQ